VHFACTIALHRERNTSGADRRAGTIAGVVLPGGAGHFVAVLSSTPNWVVIGDPLSGKLEMSGSDLNRRYHFTGFLRFGQNLEPIHLSPAALDSVFRGQTRLFCPASTYAPKLRRPCMKKLCCLAVVLLLTGFAFSQTSGSMSKSGSMGQNSSMGQNAPASADEQQLLNIEQEWANAMTSGDVATLQRIEADNYVMTNADGTTTTKEQDINGLKSGTEKYQEAELSDLKPNVNGDTATVTGKITLKGTENGKDISGTYEFTDTFAKRNGNWEAVSTTSTKLPQ
jgi:ketosteroid isomerase-like protein